MSGTPGRVLLLDIDGTLVNYATELPASAADAVRAARDRGHRVYLCTGRSRAEIYDQLWDLGVDGLIGGNGSYIEDAGQVVFHQVLDAAVVAEAVGWLLAEDLGFYLECNSGLYASDHLPEKAAAILDGGVTPENVRFIREAMPQLIYGTRAGRDDVNKISFVLEPAVDLDALAAHYAGRAAIDTWSMTGKRAEFGEFGQLGIHKGAAVERLATHLGVGAESLIGFGDARSDLGMFAACGTSVAMGNAPDEVKASATLVTDHVDADGLANAFRRLALID
ncbi:MAG: Cof-type HAD-IIB family hydrolase [Micropruina sp.]|uniref:Cof-type HAD-IIB family hydrolase n=1 Tax=Micropruina sp. TaxID=2737536 RepID=UPI0039E5F9C9